MKVYHFNKEKYQHGLQMELGKIEDIPNFDFSNTVHCTNFFEIMIFVEGNGYLQLDHQQIQLLNSQFVFISPFQKRKWFVDREGIKGYFLIFEQDFLNDFFADKLFVYRLQYFFNYSVPSSFVPNTRLFSFEHDIFEEIIQEIYHAQNDSVHLLRSILYYILIKLNREFCNYHQLENDTHLYPQAYQFKEALEKNIRKIQQVNQYADLLNISRITLNNITKKQFGKPASALIKERLLFEIKDELIYTNKTVAEIAYHLNFSEPQHLIRFFKRATNQTPAKFRTIYQNGYS